MITWTFSYRLSTVRVSKKMFTEVRFNTYTLKVLRYLHHILLVYIYADGAAKLQYRELRARRRTER